jgi:cytochrome P450
MCMILNPSIQKKAQEELDSVIGSSRLPTIQDRANLPFLRAIVAEVYRFCPAAPLGKLNQLAPRLCSDDIYISVKPGVPHVLTQDDVYEGYFIPKGTWILPNMW